MVVLLFSNFGNERSNGFRIVIGALRDAFSDAIGRRLLVNFDFTGRFSVSRWSNRLIALDLWRMRAPAERAERPNKCATRRNRQNRVKQGGTKAEHPIGSRRNKKGILRFVLSDGRNTAEQGRTKAEQGGTKPNMAEQAEQGKTKAELFRPLCAQGPYPPDVAGAIGLLVSALADFLVVSLVSVGIC
eukprot:scaffold82142_cov43-Cyclotella_meneghiniana.AAC.2